MEHSANESTMKITDLGTYCLDSCLRHSSIEGLLNIADSNKAMRHEARDVFQRMHGQKLVRFAEVLKFRDDRKCDCHPIDGRVRFKLSDKTLVIYQLKLGLQFLRCFGDLVSEMEFSFCQRRLFEIPITHSNYKPCEIWRNYLAQRDKADEWDHLLVDYLNKYCYKSLSKIKFYGNLLNYMSSDLSKLTKPFVKVEKLTSHIFFPSQSKLHELFPELRELKLVSPLIPMSMLDDGHIFLHNEFMANRFNHLEHLRIDLQSTYTFYKENFAIALRLNPQIKTLTGNLWIEVLFDPNNFNFWNPNEHFRNLERLDLEVDLHVKPWLIEILKRPVPDSEDLHFKSLRELNVTFTDYFIDDIVTEWTFPFICNRLESLTITVRNSRLKQFSNLLNKHPTVKKIEFEYCGDEFTMNFDDCSRISKAFPFLEEIYFKLLPYDMVEAVQMFHSLKYFKVFVEPISSGIAISARLVHSLNGWSISSTIDEVYSYNFIEGKRNN